MRRRNFWLPTFCSENFAWQVLGVIVLGVGAQDANALPLAGGGAARCRHDLVLLLGAGAEINAWRLFDLL